MPLPYFRFSPQDTADLGADYSRIAPGSLLDFLGFPVGFTGMNSGSSTFNAIPFLAYYDIVRNYYSNPNETRQMALHNHHCVSIRMARYLFLTVRLWICWLVVIIH